MGNKDWVALAVGQATDDEILTEGSRRGLTANIIATHGGTTAKAVLESTTDQRLREECVRRGWRSALVDMTDGQLRSECARRKFNQCGPGDMTLLCVLSRHVPEDFPSSELPSWLESTLLAARATDAEMAKRLPRNVLAQELRDDELRAECEKRKLISGDLAVVDLVRASDAALRAECARRDIQTAGAGEHYVPARDYARRESELASERDEWKRRATEAEDHATGLEEGPAAWKRRAEAAEVDLAIALKNNETLAQEHLKWLETGSPHASESLAPFIDTPEKLGRMLAGGRPHELGDGIRTLTLPSGRPVSEAIDLATLADTLCDDAD